MGSGQVPNLRGRQGGEGGVGTAHTGGGQEEAWVRQPNMTFPSAGVSSRWSPGESLRLPRGTLTDRGAKGRPDIKSEICSLPTICRPGIMFPWMNPRTADFKQSGNIIFIIFGFKHARGQILLIQSPHPQSVHRMFQLVASAALLSMTYGHYLSALTLTRLVNSSPVKDGRQNNPPQKITKNKNMAFTSMGSEYYSLQHFTLEHGWMLMSLPS